MTRWLAMVLLVAGCRDVFHLEAPELAEVDAGAAGAGTWEIADAAVDAPTVTYIAAQQDFPSPHFAVDDFTTGALAQYLIVGSGFVCCSNAMTHGTSDAPLAAPLVTLLSGTATFTFAYPIRAVGLAVVDTSLVPDEPVIVTLTAIGPDGVAAQTTQTLASATTYDATDHLARFIGFRSPIPFRTVTVALDRSAPTSFDHLMFAR